MAPIKNAECFQNWGIVRGSTSGGTQPKKHPTKSRDKLFVGGMKSFSFLIIFNILLYRMNIQTMGGFR